MRVGRSSFQVVLRTISNLITFVASITMNHHGVVCPEKITAASAGPPLTQRTHTLTSGFQEPPCKLHSFVARRHVLHIPKGEQGFTSYRHCLDLCMNLHTVLMIGRAVETLFNASPSLSFVYGSGAYRTAPDSTQYQLNLVYAPSALSHQLNTFESAVGQLYGSNHLLQVSELPVRTNRRFPLKEHTLYRIMFPERTSSRSAQGDSLARYGSVAPQMSTVGYTTPQ